MADQNDLTTNVNIANDDNSKLVDVITDLNSKERLAVDAFLTGGNFQLSPFVPVLEFDSTGISLNTSTWTTLLNHTSETGKLDFIACVGGSSSYRVRLTVDGTEVFDISMADLNSIGLANATNVPIWAETANKNFRYNPTEGVDYTDSLLIEAMATTASPTLKYLISHREIA